MIQIISYLKPYKLGGESALNKPTRFEIPSNQLEILMLKSTILGNKLIANVLIVRINYLFINLLNPFATDRMQLKFSF